MYKKLAILITTKNRIEDLKLTLRKLETLLLDERVECLVYDDASTDDTYNYIINNYPNIVVFRNTKSLGLIHNRNVLLNSCNAEFAVSLDDDANFLTDNSIETISQYFHDNPKCGVIACRIFWGLNEPKNLQTSHTNKQVKGFVGCGHIWNLKAWKDIPNYPEWFIFYGEEDFASYQLFKHNWEVHYVPSIVVHHRVDNNSRKINSDYYLRQRRSFRSGWYLYFMFYPWRVIPKKLTYTLAMQLKNKTSKGDFKATFAIFRAIADVGFNFFKLLKQSNRFTKQEYTDYQKLPETIIYWVPDNK